MEKIFSFLIDILFIILSIIFLILASLSYNNYKYDTFIINEYKQNWELGPIVDIVSVFKNNPCPINYQSFITNKFPGFKEGCDCRNSDRDEEKKIIYEKACSPKNLISKCQSIHKQDDINLEIWKGKKLCVKRLEKNFWEFEEYEAAISDDFETIFLENDSSFKLEKSSIRKNNNKNLLKSKNTILIKKTNANNKIKSKTINRQNGLTCRDPQNFKPCGYLDETLNVICVKKTEKCPINSLLILKDSDFQKFVKDKSIYNSIPLYNEFFLYFSNKKTDGKVYIEINAHIGDFYCIHPHEGLLGQNEYLLNNLIGEKKCVTKINSKKDDTRYKLLDNYNIDTFYSENNIKKLIFDKITDYNKRNSTSKNLNEGFIYKQTDKNNEVKLYTSDYIGWKKSCFNFKDNNKTYINSILDTSQEKVDKSKNIINWIKGLCAYNLAFHIFMLIFFKINILNIKEDFKTLFYLDAINFLFILVIFILSIISYGNANSILKPSFDFINNKCGDDITNDVLSFAFEKISKIKPMLLCIEISVGIQLLIYILLYLYIFNNKYGLFKKEKNFYDGDIDI